MYVKEEKDCRVYNNNNNNKICYNNIKIYYRKYIYIHIILSDKVHHNYIEVNHIYASIVCIIDALYVIHFDITVTYFVRYTKWRYQNFTIMIKVPNKNSNASLLQDCKWRHNEKRKQRKWRVLLRTFGHKICQRKKKKKTVTSYDTLRVTFPAWPLSWPSLSLSSKIL